MPISSVLRSGGLFCTGTIFEVFLKKDSYKSRETGQKVEREHWVIDVRKTINLRGKDREVSQFVFVTTDQAKVKVQEKFQKLEGMFVTIPVRVYFDKLLLDGTDPLQLND